MRFLALALATTAALSMTEQTANTCSTIEDPQACLNNDACSWCAESANRGCRGELETLLATRDAAELRAQHRQMGQSLLLLLAEMGHSLPAPVSLAWPASWAWAARALKLSDREMVQGYLYSWVANQLSAAVRLLPLGPSRAQVLQQRALPLIADQAEQLLDRDPRTLWSGGVGCGNI